MTVLWLDSAVESFQEIDNFLGRVWNLNTQQQFEERVLTKLKLLTDNPEMGRVSEDSPSVRTLLIHPTTTLYYRLAAEEIQLLYFWDNRQDPAVRPDFTAPPE